MAIRSVGVGLALVALFGCTGAGGSPDRPGEEWGLEHAYADGGVEVVLRLDRTEITTAEWVLVEVAVLAAEGLTVHLPTAQQAAAGGLTVARTHTMAPALQEDALVRRVRRFEMQPFLPGDYQVPGLAVAVAGEDGKTAATIRTEPVDLTVTSVLAEAEEPPRLQEVAEPMAAPPRMGRTLLLAVLGIAAAGVAAALVVVVRQRAARKAARSAIVPPHEAALRALRELAADDLLHRDLLAFHTAVAAVVRRYLEQRFGVRAPERTTEELMFLLTGGNLAGRRAAARAACLPGAVRPGEVRPCPSHRGGKSGPARDGHRSGAGHKDRRRPNRSRRPTGRRRVLFESPWVIAAVAGGRRLAVAAPPVRAA